MSGEFGFDYRSAQRAVLFALEEDMGFGDITTDAVFRTSQNATAKIVAKETGIIAGLPLMELIFSLMGSNNVAVKLCVKEGEQVHVGQQIALLTGDIRTLLSAERTLLNFLQRLSGIATATHEYVQAASPFGVGICDTRKTVPGLRYLDKYAVRVGGGMNHRFNLSDAVLIKDNHVAGAGSITEAVKRAKRAVSFTKKIEVEVTNLEEVKEAMDCGVDLILLDNMSVCMMSEAVKLIRKQNSNVLIEASGNVTLEKISEIAKTGVDVISVGSLTHSVKALDISMYVEIDNT